MSRKGSVRRKRGYSRRTKKRPAAWPPLVWHRRPLMARLSDKKEYNYVRCPKCVVGCDLCDHGIVHATVAERYNSSTDIRIKDNHFISRAHKKLLLAGKKKVTPYGRKD